ncbi:hypothetical protein [Psychroserpens sp.]
MRRQNLVKAKNGTKHFTPDQIENAIKVYEVNANWIFGVSDQIFNNNQKITDNDSSVHIRAQNL